MRRGKKERERQGITVRAPRDVDIDVRVLLAVSPLPSLYSSIVWLSMRWMATAELAG